MTKEYFCRNTLRDLREKTVGFPIPSQKQSGPEPSNSPAPINPTQKSNPFYLHPKQKSSTQAINSSLYFRQFPKHCQTRCF